jgi:hypothetical protein
MKNKLELFRVMCPYCKVGSAIVDVTMKHGQHEVNKDPRQCDSCRRYFALKIEMKLSGVPLESINQERAVRNALRKMVENAQ